MIKTRPAGPSNAGGARASATATAGASGRAILFEQRGNRSRFQRPRIDSMKSPSHGGNHRPVRWPSTSPIAPENLTGAGILYIAAKRVAQWTISTSLVTCRPHCGLTVNASHSAPRFALRQPAAYAAYPPACRSASPVAKPATCVPDGCRSRTRHQTAESMGPVAHHTTDLIDPAGVAGEFDRQ